jgi:hypothetical protein
MSFWTSRVNQSMAIHDEPGYVPDAMARTLIDLVDTV